MARSRSLLAGLLAVAVIAPPTLGAGLYRCGMTGQVHVGTCCDRDDEHGPSARVESEPCCVLVARSERSTSAGVETEARSVRVLGAALPIGELAPFAPPLSRVAATPEAPSRAPPRNGALWLSTCSLLI